VVICESIINERTVAMGACDWGWIDTRMTEARSEVSVPFGW
jgi:hypothetical protein